MAQKKDTPASTRSKESKKTTSRRTFGKQLTGALAALPIAGMISTPGASVLASELSEAKRPAFKGPSSGVWNGSERYRAIEPALPTALRHDALYQGATLPQAAKAEVNSAVAAAAKASGATEAQINYWLESYVQLGKPGLFSDLVVDEAECAAEVNGTWELTSRFSGGEEVATRSRIYNDMDPATASGKQLITMVTDVNLVEAGAPSTIIFMGFADLKFKQNGPYEVVVTAQGLIYGNVPGYEDGLKTTDVFRLVRKGQNETMVGYPERTQSNDEAINVTRTLVEVGGDPGTIKYKMWGVPATKNGPRTLDTIDTYALMGTRRPLVGGWEPIQDYFDRVARQGFSRIQAPSRDTLRRAVENVKGLRAAARAKQ
jgi:hypothetical protein